MRFGAVKMEGAVMPTAVRLAVVGALATMVFPAAAQVKAPVEDKALGEVVVSASRTEQDIDDVPATATTITQDKIQRDLPNDIQDLLKAEAGVSVRALPNRASAAFYSTGRGGNEGINIRGLEGNQVLLQTDGVRLPMGFSSGPFSAGRGDYIDIEAYKRVEILRGPSSTQFGSDGLSGAVSFLTKDPADLLTLGQAFQAAVKTGYASADKSVSLVPSLAVRGDRFEGMVLASLRRGHETETMGTNDAPNNTRTVPNPQDIDSGYVLAKLLFKASTAHRFKITAERLDRQVDTDVYTLFGDPLYPTTTDVNAREDITRDMLKLDYDYSDVQNRWFQHASASVYVQQSKNHQWGYERRTNTTAWNERTRDTHYAEDTVGGSVLFESNFGDTIAHRLVYGLDISVADVTSLKDGAQFLNGNKVTSGASAFVVNKSFPDTDYTLAGAFVQDEIALGEQWLVVPGVRIDSFKLKPRADALYTVNNATPPATLDAHEWSPKLGAIWRLAPTTHVFAQYAHGFRAPTPSQVNGGVSNLTASQPYMSIGNPNLKPETSNSFELGVRGRSTAWRYSLSAFRGRYDDFIAANQKVGGSGTASDPTIFQSLNFGKVEISGVEARGEWAYDKHWSVQAAYSRVKGDQKDAGTSLPLDTIDPDKLVLGVRYDHSDAVGGQLTATLVERKKRNPDPSTYTPGGFGLVDVTAWYRWSERVSINAGIFNLFDRKYAWWADVRGMAADSTIIDAFTQPGRHISVAVRAEF